MPWSVLLLTQCVCVLVAGAGGADHEDVNILVQVPNTTGVGEVQSNIVKPDCGQGQKQAQWR